MSRSEFGAARIALATIALLLPSMAAAQSTRDRLDALEARVLQTESVLQGQGLAELSTRLDELAAQVRALRGELEAQAEEQVALRKRLAELTAPASPEIAAALVEAAPVAAAPVAAAPVAEAPVAAAVPVAEAPAGKEVKAKAEPVSLAPSSTSPTPGQLFVLGLLLLGVVGAGVLLRRRTVVEQQHLAVVASRTLGRGKQLIVVDAGDSRLLLGVTEQGITLLSSTASNHAPRTSQAPMQSPAFSLFTEEQEATMASKTGLFQELGAKVGGLWGRPTPTPAAADWGDFDRILASTIPDTPNTDAPPTNHRRSAERKSTPINGSGDLAELSRELQRHGARRSA